MSYELRDGNEITEFEIAARMKGAANKRYSYCELATTASAIAARPRALAAGISSMLIDDSWACLAHG